MHRPIGLFDSGFGGLTVMREVARILPHENLIYLGDTAHLPYGNKSPEAVVRFALENAAFLLEKEIKLLMIPCHTACCHAIALLQEQLPIPVIGVIQPGLDLVKDISRIAVLGTTSTIESGLYQSLIKKQNPKALISAKACPLFVPLIEEGFYNHPSMDLIAASYLAPMKGSIDAALLACTHYPLIRPALQKVLGPQVTLLEPAERCAQQAKDYLSKEGLLNPQKEKPVYQFFATDDPEKFRRLGEVFFGTLIERVEKKQEFMKLF
jgi:glutamate racemase